MSTTTILGVILLAIGVGYAEYRRSSKRKKAPFAIWYFTMIEKLPKGWKEEEDSIPLEQETERELEAFVVVPAKWKDGKVRSAIRHFATGFANPATINKVTWWAYTKSKRFNPKLSLIQPIENDRTVHGATPYDYKRVEVFSPLMGKPEVKFKE